MCVLYRCTQAELLEWQLLTGWSPEHHSRFPPAFRQAVRLLLMAAAHQGSSKAHHAAMDTAVGQAASDPGAAAGDADGGLLLSQLPSVVLERVIADAALPQGEWAAGKVPTLQQLLEALEARPRLPEGELHGPMGWPWNMFPGPQVPANAGAAVAAAGPAGGMPPGALQMMMQLQAMAQQGMFPGMQPELGAQPNGQEQQPPPQ